MYFLLFFVVIHFTSNAQIIETRSISCPGVHDGQLNIHPTFGVEPYTYLWSTGSTENIIKGLPAGTYSVDVTDATLVTQSYSYELKDALPITNIFNITPNSNWPANNGSFEIISSGGSGSFFYSAIDSTTQKETVQLSNTFSNVAPGVYYLKTTDLIGCVAFDTITVPESAGVNNIHTLITKACYRSVVNSTFKPDTSTMVFPVEIYLDGTLFKRILGYVKDTLSYTDGINDYPINGIKPWSPLFIMQTDVITAGPNIGQDTVTLFAAPTFTTTFKAGDHYMEVITGDNKGYRHKWTVDSVDVPISITYVQANVNCFGAKTGALSVLAQGGYNGYSYSITGGPTGFIPVGANSASSLGAGRYRVTVTDKVGCTKAQDITITQPDEPNRIVFDSYKNPICTANNGEIKVARVDGARAPVSYSWSNGQLTKDISSLAPNKYVVTASDANGCKAKDSITLVQTTPYPAIRISFDSIINPICTSNNGVIRVRRVEGATEPIAYNWSNGETTKDIVNLTAGKYVVTTTDANGCITKDSAEIVVSDLSQYMSLGFAGIQYPICTANNGSVRISRIAGAKAPIDILWSNGETTEEISDLSPGKYTVTVTDAYGCFIEDSVDMVLDDQSLDMKIEFEPLKHVTCTVENAAVKISRTLGGNAPYSYSWSNGATTPNISNLGVGKYFLTVEDKHGCITEDSVEIIRTNEPITIDFGIVKNTRCALMANGEINIYEVEDALHPVSFNWSNGAATQNIDGLLTGWYKVTATDANGCIVEDSMFVAAEQTNCIYNIVTPNGDGYNDYLDLTDISNGLEMEAKIFNESGKLVATLNNQNPIWDAYSPSLPPTGSSSSYTVYITLKKDGVTIAQIGETISVIYSN